MWPAPGVGVATDARRKEVYWAAYDDAGGRCDGPHVDLPEVARAALSGRAVVGDGALLYGFASTDLPRYPSLARLAEVAIRAHGRGEAPLPLIGCVQRLADSNTPSSLVRRVL